MWVVSRMEDVEAVFSDHETFSGRIVQDPVFPLCGGARSSVEASTLAGDVQQRATGPRAHQGAHDEGLLNRRMAILEPFIRANAERRRRMLAGPRPAELVHALAFPLPAYTVFRHIGFPDEDAEQLKRWCGNRKLFQWGRATEAEQVAIAENMVAYWHYCQAFTEAKLHDLGGTTSPATCSAPTSRTRSDLTLDEVKSVVYGLSFAGHEAVTNLLCNTVRQLLAHRDQWDEVCADLSPGDSGRRGGAALRLQPGLVAPDHQEAGGGRWRRDPRGGKLLLLFAAANHDPGRFEAPDQFDIHRRQRPPSHQLRQGHPLLPGRRHGPARGPHRPRHARPPGAVTAPGRGPGLPGLPEHHLPRPRAAWLDWD